MALSVTLSTLSSSPTSSFFKPLSDSSSLSSLQLHFPSHLRRHFRNSAVSLAPLRRRFPPSVEAKKQTFSSFDELVANSDKPVLVDFYATWCGPCQLMVPILENVSATLKDKIQVVKIDTEKYPSLANQYKIEALPTFILFKNGQPSDRFEGALAAEKLIERIEESLAIKS
ncbi:hypothetical protein RND81_01G158100 [Saponaria officinalis]|uniref:Thioredoxin domain-containing protein n=1 Tax=Saponaria officinalis TaxID=3572 RepID=A0AAW1NEK3_SAPOF